MGDLSPGLQPGESNKIPSVDNQIVSNRQGELPTSSISSEEVPDSPKSSQQVEENTPAATETSKEPVKVEVPETPKEEFSEKASKRFQTLANALEEERSKRLVAEQIAQRLVNYQPQPKPEDAFEKQFKSYDPSLGYPTDPREYTNFVGKNAENKAREASRQETLRERNNAETLELMKVHPEAMEDTILIGAIAAEKNAALKRGEYITLSDAATSVKAKLEKKYAKEYIRNVENDIASKNEAYVETTKGGSTQRAAEKPQTEFKNLTDMEKKMKEMGIWDEGFSK